MSAWYDKIESTLGSATELLHRRPHTDSNGSLAKTLGGIAEQLSMRRRKPPAGAAPESAPEETSSEETPPAVAPSGGLTIPWALQRLDSDTGSRWGGQKREQSAQYVRDLQARLVALGYWTSAPSEESGMACDGSFGAYTEGAVATLQLEHMAIDAAGTIDETKVTGIVDEATLRLINQGPARPAHTAKNAMRNVDTAAPAPFIQLPPATHFARYGTNYDNDANVQFRILPAKMFRIMADNWGQAELIRTIRDTAREWVEVKGREMLLVGDLSLFAGGPMEPHETHRYGTGADIDHANYCSVNTDTFDVDASLELANLFAAHGATCVYFNCHHVISNCAVGRYAGGHHHHFHVDREFSATKGAGGNSHFTTCANCNKYATCQRKILKIAKKTASGTDTAPVVYKPGTHKVAGELKVYLSRDVALNDAWYAAEIAAPPPG